MDTVGILILSTILLFYACALFRWGFDFSAFPVWLFRSLFDRKKDLCYRKVDRVVKHFTSEEHTCIRVRLNSSYKGEYWEQSFLFTKHMYDYECVKVIESIPLVHRSIPNYGWCEFPYTYFRPLYRVIALPDLTEQHSTLNRKAEEGA